MQTSKQAVGKLPHFASLSAIPHRRIRVAAHGPQQELPLASSFAEHMLALEMVLPTMSCSQLAQTGTSVRGVYKAALLSGSDSGVGSDAVSRDLLDYFNSQLPNQSWLITYRDAVQKHLAAPEQLNIGGGEAAADAPTTALNSTGLDAAAAAAAGGGAFDSACSGAASPVCSCSPEHLADILSTVASLPIQVVQPLPIGFGTPRWSRPMAASDPAAWEHWLAHLTRVYTALLEQQLQLLQQQQQPAGSRECDDGSIDVLLQQLADFTISLACSMRWVNVNVDDDRLQTPEFRQRVLQCLKQQQQELHAAAQQQIQHKQQSQQSQQRVEQQQHDASLTAEGSLGGRQERQVSALQQPQRQHVPFALAGSLAHRLTYTCLLLMLPPPRPMLRAFFSDTHPSDFTLPQLQSIVRGCLFVGAAPAEPWLQGLVQRVRDSSGQLGQKEVLGFVEAFRFFGTQVGRTPWLRDVTALLEEFSCVG